MNSLCSSHLVQQDKIPCHYFQNVKVIFVLATQRKHSFAEPFIKLIVLNTIIENSRVSYAGEYLEMVRKSPQL